MPAAIPELLLSVASDGVISQPVDAEVDARGLACPMPLLKAKLGLRNLAVNQCLRVLATDAGSLRDFVSFAQLTGQVIEGFYQQDGVYAYLIRKQ